MSRRRGKGALSPAEEAEARALYEAGGMTNRAIGERFGVSRNTIIGLAHRHWIERDKTEPEPSKLLDRMNVLDAMMAEVLRRYPPGTGFVKLPPKEKGPRARDWVQR